ncbi:hypothetical protein CFP65_6142 [Kitasatospora sp. MMS16-BH015]|uniref:hypothetical protein n=1 Tax=Kitasatospora sp. MMS16-BH015 TaxID=2018025 RepID=UPI000CA2640F|nr:hypothetical protein [Kitasatospora sp. MMS16-BH015]AUG80809.1 hypothetical protein CFP65_6142 [Kitasatospora sp. MMS16-BH015]
MRRTTATVTFLTALLGTATACSSPGTPASTPTAREQLQAAAKAMELAGGAQLRIDQTWPGDAVQQVATVRWHPSLQAVFDGDNLRLVNGAAFQANRVAGKTWTRADGPAGLASNGHARGPDALPTALLKVYQRIDPAKGLARAAAGSPSVVGQEEIQGTPTTHLHAQLAAADYYTDPTEAAGSRRDELRALLKKLGTTEVTADFWLDRDGRLLRRVETEDSTLGQVTTTTSFSRFGVPKEVTAPPADQVADTSEVLDFIAAAQQP